MNIQEQVANFEKICQNRHDNKKYPKPNGIKIPFFQEEILEFQPGERYLFANRAEMAHSSLVRHFLLWCFALHGATIEIYGERAVFEMDFLHLLSYESQVPVSHIRCGLRTSGQDKNILEALEKIRNWRICWKNPSDTGGTEEPVVKFLIFNQPDWQSQWEQFCQIANNQKHILLGFLEGQLVKDCQNESFFYPETPAFPQETADYFCLACKRSAEEALALGETAKNFITLTLKDNNRLISFVRDFAFDEYGL